MYKLLKRLLNSDNPNAQPLQEMVEAAQDCGMPDYEIEQMLDKITTDKLGRKWNPDDGKARRD